MKKLLTVLLFVLASLVLLGCSTTITVPIDSTVFSKDKATLIIYHDQGINDIFRVFIDTENVGSVTSETPLKIAVTPGQHELYADAGALIRQKTTKTFEADNVYFMKVWCDFGDRFIGSIRIDLANKIESYRVRSFK